MIHICSNDSNISSLVVPGVISIYMIPLAGTGNDGHFGIFLLYGSTGHECCPSRFCYPTMYISGRDGTIRIICTWTISNRNRLVIWVLVEIINNIMYHGRPHSAQHHTSFPFSESAHFNDIGRRYIRWYNELLLSVIVFDVSL
jgi:hypothetical protein